MSPALWLVVAIEKEGSGAGAGAGGADAYRTHSRLCLQHTLNMIKFIFNVATEHILD
jgi:hypothetical protein